MSTKDESRSQDDSQSQQPPKKGLVWAFRSGGKCRAGIIAGAVTGLLAGVGVAIPLCTTLFQYHNQATDQDELHMVPFIILLLLVGVIGLFGGAWGGALAAKCWEPDTPTVPEDERQRF